MHRILRGATVLLATAAASAACSSSSSSSSSGGSPSNEQHSCTIAAGTYKFDVTAHGPSACVGESSDMSWPPTTAGKMGIVTETCTTTTTMGSECQATCSTPGAPTTVYTYTVSDSGFAGSLAEPGTAGDAGAVCTYTFTATPD